MVSKNISRRAFIVSSATALASVACQTPRSQAISQTQSNSYSPRTIEKTLVGNNSASLTAIYLNDAACFGFKYQRGKERTYILVDPWNHHATKEFQEFRENALFVPVTHGHHDHTGSDPLEGNLCSTILCTETAKKKILSGLPKDRIAEAERRIISSKPGETRYVSENVSVLMLPSSHIEYTLPLSIQTLFRGVFTKKGNEELNGDWPTVRQLVDSLFAKDCLAPYMSFGDDLNALFLGSAGDKTTQEWKDLIQKGKIKNPNILFLPYLGLDEPEMSERALEIVKIFKPGELIIHHYLGYIPPITPFSRAVRPEKLEEILKQNGINILVTIARPGDKFVWKF